MADTGTFELPTVLFDGSCRLCTAQAQGLRDFSRGKVAVMAYQSVQSTDPRLRRAELERELKLVMPDGRVLGGAGAIVRVTRLARPVLGLLLVPYYIPGIRQLADLAYAWVARNRYRLFGRSGPDSCADGTCSRTWR